MPIKKGDILVHIEHRNLVIAASDEADRMVTIKQMGTFSPCPVGQLEPVSDFEFIVYSKRWGHNDTYHVKLTSTGWHVDHIAINGDCDPSGKPYLFENLEQDSIQHPANLGSQMSTLWQRATSGKFTPAEIQEQLELIASPIRQLNGGV